MLLVIFKHPTINICSLKLQQSAQRITAALATAAGQHASSLPVCRADASG